MEYRDWQPLYRQIVSDFGFDASADAHAARALASLLDQGGFNAEDVWQRAARGLQGKSVLVVGAADDAAAQLRRHHQGQPLIAADGATTACLEVGSRPDVIVTDLDGNVPDEIDAASQGSLVLVHAHGDNQEAVSHWLHRFPAAQVAGTCQCAPVAPLKNHGGFTDGDRACFIADALGATRLRLVGFDLQGRPGRYSGAYDPQTKPRKLAWAERLLVELVRRGVVIDRA